MPNFETADYLVREAKEWAEDPHPMSDEELGNEIYKLRHAVQSLTAALEDVILELNNEESRKELGYA